MGEEGAPRIAVIGAGLAGLLCARRLQDAGLHPVVFEKSRGLGGRLATRRA
ncbi:MAG TPA: FAD-binding protein, partial [Kiloniellaceae bacterium]|nr:FAD-binding protein [Kiloniellaceae bacterium]